MYRRHFNSASVSALGLLLWSTAQQVHALSLADLSDKEANQGLKTALEKSALAAVGLLGKTDGFLGNEKVRIPLPGYLEDAAKWLKKLGQGKRVDELVTSMNRAAEAAVPLAKDALVGAVKSMNFNDAKNILSGGDNAMTNFFAEKTRTPLFGKFLPVVTQATERVGAANQYNQLAGKAAGLGLIKKEDASIQDYITHKTLDGLYLMIGEQEKNIRQDPIGTGSAVLKKVFGASF
ncbi:hypothetical protein J2X19_004556 [Rhodoferax ferrireducens]|uniref:DUF4197 domain-containing protein n=1 Tax=Rhodoferax ferrireducens TaxID=192843 RepID=A0ABU2CEU5_9BURK|nr:DUF4197 domain-containing protein [Rhodoferax ferrireducens]MDR7379860.1 hypothetical protein [Rhodoferax ferrireducens]